MIEPQRLTRTLVWRGFWCSRLLVVVTAASMPSLDVRMVIFRRKIQQRVYTISAMYYVIETYCALLA